MGWPGPHPKLGKMVPCVHCRKEVYRAPSAMLNKYCSMKCRDEAVRARRVNLEDGTARCAKCREWKPFDQFVRGIKSRPHSYCKPCSSTWFHERRGTEPEKRKPYQEAYTLSPEAKKQNKRDANRRQHLVRRAAGPAPHKFDLGRMMCEQDAKCAYCKQLLTVYHIDHKMPVSRGGTNDIENLQLTCPRCNMRKGAMTHEEYLASKRRRVVDWQ